MSSFRIKFPQEKSKKKNYQPAKKIRHNRIFWGQIDEKKTKKKSKRHKKRRVRNINMNKKKITNILINLAKRELKIVYQVQFS